MLVQLHILHSQLCTAPRAERQIPKLTDSDACAGAVLIAPYLPQLGSAARASDTALCVIQLRPAPCAPLAAHLQQ